MDHSLEISAKAYFNILNYPMSGYGPGFKTAYIPIKVVWPSGLASP